MGDRLLSVEELNLPEDFELHEHECETDGHICTICSDCCLCETGGV